MRRCWRSVAPVAYSELDFQLTWIAVAQPGATLVRTTDRPAMECPCYGDAPGLRVVAAGVGEGRVGPWTNRAPPFITLAVAAPSSADTCAFRAVNQAGDEFLDEPAVEVFDGFIPGASLAPDNETAAEVWLDIVGDCAWAVSVFVPPG